MEHTELVANQRSFFASGATRPIAFRLKALHTLRDTILSHEEDINRALKLDLNKSATESYMSEIGMVLEEIRFHSKHLHKWAQSQRVATPLAQFHARSFRSPEPYGVALILAPWNYPLQLCLLPLVGAISAGNCAVVKPSAYAPETSHVVAAILGEAFPPEYVACVEGGRAENQSLLNIQFDYIFFTGSVAVGKLAMEAAAKHLTPLTLELGGKSPVIVDKTADIPLAARRIAFGKTLNAGQTCVAPDYLLIQKDVKEQFVTCYQEALAQFFPKGDYSQMATIVNEKHYRRLMNLLSGQEQCIGGEPDDSRRFIPPILLDTTDPASPIMQEEIFGPILPMLPFDTVSEAIAFVRDRPKPLAIYLFTSDPEIEKTVLDSCSFGGGCVNDTIIHLATSRMAFGGVGSSGMGSYHGRQSFDTFTHYRSIVRKSTWLDLPLRYMPYTVKKLTWIKRFMK